MIIGSAIIALATKSMDDANDRIGNANIAMTIACCPLLQRRAWLRERLLSAVIIGACEIP